MIKKGTKIGGASPVRKAFVAFMLGRLAPSVVALAFEGRLELEDAELIIAEYRKNVGEYAKALPQGKFEPFGFDNLPPGVQVKHNGQIIEFDGLGTYADWLDEPDTDATDSVHWLKRYARSMTESFCDYDDLPPVEELEAAFITGKGYQKVQPAINRVFSEAKRRGTLIPAIYAMMSDFHEGFVRNHGLDDFVGKVSDEVFMMRITDVLPLGIANEESAGAVFASVLPILLMSGVEIDPKELFAYRLERGRMYLIDLSSFYDSEEVPEHGEYLRKTLSDVLKKHPERLQPDISGNHYAMEIIRDNAQEFADKLVESIYEAEKAYVVPEFFLFV